MNDGSKLVNDTPVVIGAKQIYSVDMNDVFKRAIKYLLLGFVIAISARTVPDKPLAWRSVIIISLIGCGFFVVLDTYSPTVGISDNAEVQVN